MAAGCYYSNITAYFGGDKINIARYGPTYNLVGRIENILVVFMTMAIV